uniref:adenylate dimethylallyltransferase (ADP/ATP-dependent) n=1 Tax=Brassica campestris TaxID=3711 RepID=M4EHR1_BRACM
MKFSISAPKQVQPILSFKNKPSIVNVNSFLHPREKVVFVMGATGSGKSRLAIDLAHGVPHHLLGVFDSEDGNLTATDFTLLASQEISTLSANNKLPIVAGGSNSYIEALANHSSGLLLNNYECCFIWVDVSLPVLNAFVSKRVDRMMEAGLLDEVRQVYDPKADYSVGIRRAIGVPELHEYLRYESLVDRATQRKMLDVAVRKIKQNTEILACRQLQKIQRLSKKWKPCMHHVDATEVFLKHNEEEADEAWENLVARPTKRIVDKFSNRHVMKNDSVEHCLTTIGAASYGGGSGSRAHNMI